MPKLIKRDVLILACGRSGTLYTSRVFKSVKYDVGHEKIGENGSISMYLVAGKTDCTSINKGQKTLIHAGEDRANYEFGQVWHQLRHPLKAIDSLAKSFTRKVRAWTGEQLGVPLPGRAKELQCSIEDKLHWAMHYWLQNNLLCEKQAAWTYSLETFPWEEMLERLGLPSQSLPTLPTTTNRGLRYAFKSKEQTAVINKTMYDTDWKRLRAIDRNLAQQVRENAERWGYKT